MVKVLIHGLGYEKYGIWVTISSILTYFIVFDFGLGQGLKNHLTISFSLKDFKTFKKEVSTGYISIIGLSLIITACLLIINQCFGWIKYLNIPINLENEVLHSVFILIALFGLMLPTKLVGTVFSSLQFPHIDNVIKLLGQLFFFIFSILLIYFKNSLDLIQISILSLLPSITIYLLSNIYLFKYKLNPLKPSIRYFDKEVLRRLAKPSLNFLAINIGVIVLMNTDNLIILTQKDGNSVATYNVLYKLYSFPYVFFNLYVATHWNAFTDAFVHNRMKWIHNKLKLFKLLILPIFLLYLIIYYSEGMILRLWLGDEYTNSNLGLSRSIILYFIISSFNAPGIYLINSIGTLHLQKILFILISILNIPLSIFLIKIYDISGVIIASSICLLPLMAIMNIQSNKILNRTARGIWNK